MTDKEQLMGREWIVQQLAKDWHGYEGWNTFTVRDERNCCVAVVGDVDRAVAPFSEQAAILFAAAPELLKACKDCLASGVVFSGVAAMRDAVEKAERAIVFK